MKSLIALVPSRPAIFGQPCPAFERPLADAAAISGESEAMGEMLAGLLNQESTLYGLTREWHYDARGGRDRRLQALLDAQFSELGLRLTQLAARSRELGFSSLAGHGQRTASPRAVVAAGVLEAHLLRELLGLHEALSVGLRRGSSVAQGQFHDRKTAALLAGLAARHEIDAFMLRALLWEVENVPA
jgi:DNA-binding ferritin-like protein